MTDIQSAFAAMAPPEAPLAYRVLARTWRPTRLSELVGQDALVRSLTNAIHTGRIAHAFLLTGIRGIGKTTTARIIARALNCIGEDGQGGPTPEPCGRCSHCRQITEDRHIDVLEMDAATRTGIDDIREIVESVRYAPTSARFKVYIIDEVHMLSEKAFNGLLKTLEEPPPQAKFVFATTEVRKVPVTILSRCQRFDLRRVGHELLAQHLTRIAEVEGIQVAPDALIAICRAAGGSVRDALSLLDQAIALSSGEAARIELAQVHDMLGLADHGRIIGLFELLMRGEVRACLDALDELHQLGSEPEVILGELLEVTHWVTRLKTAPDRDSAPVGGEAFGARGEELAAGLSLAVLARTWQMLLKGLDELRLAPDTLRAAEMVLVRIAFAADLPPPEAIARHRPPVEPAGMTSGGAVPSGSGGGVLGRAPVERTEPVLASAAHVSPDGHAPAPADFAAVVELFRRQGEPMLHGWLFQQAELVEFQDGEIVVRIDGPAPADWPLKAGQSLTRWTGRTWTIRVSDRPGEPTLAVQAAARKQERIAALSDDPRLRPVLDAFPGARIVDVREATGAPASEAAE
ncbi:MAG: DNA polymerase III subunit gamma/tau [Geminicoccaceae bacterium]|nr:DNA polymerase III subunit gamma/tau [Geminicoccaceae bacterium]